MSPRAAWRLERFGFEAYDYALGKADWLAAGLPSERAHPGPPRVSTALDAGVVTCSPDELVRDVAARVDNEDCLVVNDDGILLGRVRVHASTVGDATVEDAMHPGPTTVRADADLHQTRERMRTRSVSSLAVTTPQGVLLGIIHAADHT